MEERQHTPRQVPMISASSPNKRSVTGFRTKLLAAMMLVVSGLTALGLYFAQRNVVTNTGRDLQQQFQVELSWLHYVHGLRMPALAERCRSLPSYPSIRPTLQDIP